MAKIVSYHIAYIRLFLRLDIYYIPLYSCQYYDGALTSNISMQQVHIFFWCWNSLLIDYCDAYSWVFFR